MRKVTRLFLLFGTALLLMGTVVQKKDPIQKTQTDPVSAGDVLKQEAEGKKGAPAPSMNLFPKERFLVEGPVEKEQLKEEKIESTEEFKLNSVTDDTSHTSEDSWQFDDTSK